MTVPAGAAEKPAALRSDEAGSQPIEITADTLNADSDGRTVTFEGNVVATQGDVTLHADRLFAEYSRGQTTTWSSGSSCRGEPTCDRGRTP